MKPDGVRGFSHTTPASATFPAIVGPSIVLKPQESAAHNTILSACQALLHVHCLYFSHRVALHTIPIIKALIQYCAKSAHMEMQHTRQKHSLCDSNNESQYLI